MRRFFEYLGISLIIFFSIDASADIGYPARLKITELETGLYEVVFTLPIVEGKVLKAKPLLPGMCEPLEEPLVTSDYNAKIVKFKIRCEPPGIEGQNFGIEGLSGQSVDIILEVSLLQGQIFTAKLNPTNAFYTIPKSPGFFDLFWKATKQGVQIPLQNLATILLFLCFIPFLSRKDMVKLGVVFTLGVGLGVGLSALGFLQVPGFSFNLGVFALITAFMLKLDYHKLNKRLSSHLVPFFLLSGLFLGAISGENLVVTDLSYSNRIFYLVEMSFGILLGSILIILLCVQFIAVIKLLKKWRSVNNFRIFMGALAFGLFLYECTGLYTAPGLIPEIPSICFLLVISFTLWQGILGNVPAQKSLFLLILFLCLGLGLGFRNTGIRFLDLIVLFGSVYCMVNLAFLIPYQKTIQVIILSVTLFAGGIYSGAYAKEYLSYPQAQAAGFTIILAFTFVFFSFLFEGWSTTKKIQKLPVHVASILFIFFIAIWIARFKEYYLTNYKVNMVSGGVPVPVVSLLLLTLAYFLWPKDKKSHKALGIEKSKPLYSVLALSSSLLLLPFLFKFNNPYFEPNDLNKEQVQEVMGDILNNTYTAFNEKNELKLFEALSENVDETLVEDIYLDSRRRLSMGLKEGSEVTVEKVAIENVGEYSKTEIKTGAIEFPVEWIVTAKVRHLKHIHYRNNRYSGLIRIRTDENRWKISKITLTSEDRSITSSSKI